MIDREMLEIDPSFDSVRDTDWFRAIVEGL